MNVKKVIQTILLTLNKISDLLLLSIKSWRLEAGIMAHDALEVSYYFLTQAKQAGIALTPMQLIKLVYMAHGWMLGIDGQPLIFDKVEAWQYGPVIPSVYHTFKNFGHNPITIHENELNHRRFTFNDLEISVLDKVFGEYGKLPAFQLSDLTHRKGSPWYKVYIEEDNQNSWYVEIPNEVIRDYYAKMVA